MNKLPNLKRKRKEKGYSRKQMAEKLGVSIHSYEAYEKGVRNPLLETTLKILNVLDCKMEELTKDNNLKED